tara:strand:- start:917 stop:1948 length:1032 start_codon:yes stop_codon:yes gene_type:complete
MFNVTQSATVESLYTVTIPRDQAISGAQLPSTDEDYVILAMSQLLTRVTGRIDAFLEPSLQELVRNADSPEYVMDKGWPDLEGYRVTFDGRAILDALFEINEPIWVGERPLILLWLAVDTESGERGILASESLREMRSVDFVDTEDEIRNELIRVATSRGLPIRFPFWDSEDMNSLDFIDIWNGFSNRVLQSSLRYGADAILNGRVWDTPRGREVQWTLIRGNERFILPGRTISSGLEQLADLYSREFSSFGDPTVAYVTVTNLSTLEDYAQVMNYIEDLQERYILNSVDIEEYTETTLSLRLIVRGGSQLLGKVLTLNNFLSPVPAISDDPLEGRLTFSLNK